MNERVEHSVNLKGRRSAAPSQAPGEAASEGEFGNAYRRARAHVLEAGTLGLCRLRIA